MFWISSLNRLSTKTQRHRGTEGHLWIISLSSLCLCVSVSSCSSRKGSEPDARPTIDRQDDSGNEFRRRRAEIDRCPADVLGLAESVHRPAPENLLHPLFVGNDRFAKHP